jgi:hypothetical protein
VTLNERKLMPVTFYHTNNEHIGYECVGEGKRKRKV